ncbi:MAG: rhomboid family intramembrane serine protease [Chloroflexota bacterium]|nr:rhomboid family intramembrane serine protease [Chloroflexota bacterium]
MPLHEPRLTWVLLAVNVGVWLLMTALGGSERLDVLIAFGAKFNPLIVEGQVWRLLTSIFLHIGVVHLFFNSYALFRLGMDVERVFGSGRFLILYLLAGVSGSLLSFAFNPHLSAGASGAIFGLIGATGAHLFRHREAFGRRGQRRLWDVIGVAFYNLAFGFITPGIDNLGHLGGLVSGVLLGWLLGPRYSVVITAEGQPLVVDQSDWRRYWPGLFAVVLVLVMGTGLAVWVQADSAAVHLWWGQAALDAGDPARAVTELERAVAKDPRSADAHFYLGVAYGQLEQSALAVESYEQAVRLAPGAPAIHWNLALTYADLGLYEEAISRMEKFIALGPEQAYLSRAQAYINLWQRKLGQ